MGGMMSSVSVGMRTYLGSYMIDRYHGLGTCYIRLASYA
jgi:hypothetical protein